MSSRGAPGIEYAYFPLCCYVMKFGETSPSCQLSLAWHFCAKNSDPVIH